MHVRARVFTHGHARMGMHACRFGYCCCEIIFPWICNISACLWIRDSDSFCFRLSFQGCLNSLGKGQCHPEAKVVSI